jgi:serine/threonine protein kinase
MDTLNTLPVGTHLQEFIVEKIVGIGGFGIVYQANDTLLHRSVAIKEYMPTSMASRQDGSTVSVRSQAYTDDFENGKRSFINEARMLAHFKHAALIEVFRFWEQNGTAYMAMPFYEGKTLKETLQTPGASRPDQAYLLKIMYPIFDALQVMHHEQIFHRDISPDNIMVLRDDRPILLDLGAARKVLLEGSQALTVMVKPGYAPIEQYADDASIKQGPWTDIYAIGAVLHFAITGKAPPPAASRLLNDTMPRLEVKAADVSFAAGFTKEFLQAVDAALRVRPEDRPQTIAEFRKLLNGELIRGELTSEALKQTVQEQSEPMPNQFASIAPVAEAYADSDHTIVLPRTLTKTGLASPRLLDVTSAEESAMTNADPVPEIKKGFGGLMAAAAIGAVVLGAGIFMSIKPSAPVPPSPSATKEATAPAVIAAPIVKPSVQTEVQTEVVKPVEAPLPEVTVDQAKKAEKLSVIRLNVKPWGEIFVDGATKGISPPMKALNLPAGEYSIEIRNGDFAPHSQKLIVKAGESFNLTHAFSDSIQAK